MGVDELVSLARLLDSGEHVRQAQAKYPELFVNLRRCGWSEERRIPVTDELEDAALEYDCTVPLYADDFLERFHGIRLYRAKPDGTKMISNDREIDITIQGRVSLIGGVGKMPYIRKIAGSRELTPVMTFGSTVVFLLGDGRAIALGAPFMTCIHAEDIFAMMNCVLLSDGKPCPGVVNRTIRTEEKPPIYRP